MEIRVHRVHGRSDTPRVSPAPLNSTQRRQGHIDRVGRADTSRVCPGTDRLDAITRRLC